MAPESTPGQRVRGYGTMDAFLPTLPPSRLAARQTSALHADQGVVTVKSTLIPEYMTLPEVRTHDAVVAVPSWE